MSLLEAGLAKAAELGWQVPPGLIVREDWTGKDLDRLGLLRPFELAMDGKIEGAPRSA